jgi:clan AA aspartic protease
MNGTVDGNNRALLPLNVRSSFEKGALKISAWIDTAFDGHFVFSSNLIKEMELETLAETEAILADGSKVLLQTYVCYIEWFGERLAAQVVENNGRIPLVGRALLDGRFLTIDYRNKSVEIS